LLAYYDIGLEGFVERLPNENGIVYQRSIQIKTDQGVLEVNHSGTVPFVFANQPILFMSPLNS
jgi:hypothetical protein